MRDMSNDGMTIRAALQAAKLFIESLDEVDDEAIQVLDRELCELWHIDNVGVRIALLKDAITGVMGSIIERRIM